MIANVWVCVEKAKRHIRKNLFVDHLRLQMTDKVHQSCQQTGSGNSVSGREKFDDTRYDTILVFRFVQKVAQLKMPQHFNVSV